MSDPRIVTNEPGGSALSRAARSGLLDAEVFAAAPRTVEGWRARARDIGGAAPAAWLDALRGALGGGPAADRLGRVAASRGVVVTTGQQAGLFGGPMYTWVKAVGALALADAIERETGVAAAPVFWAATDDADYAEAAATYVLTNDAPGRLALVDAPSPGTPMASAPLGGVALQLAALRAACGSMAFAPAFDAVAAAYRPGATVGGAYVALLRALLEPLGIAVLDASHPAVRRAGAPVLRHALAHAPGVAAALDARHAWLAARGYEPQVADVPGLSTVFVHEQGVKRRVPLAEAAALARSAEPEALSPNVLLRPVLERAVLPTVAYLAGPGELAYFAQVSAVAAALGAPQPLAVPRWSCTIVEPAVDRALARLGAGLDDLQHAEAITARVARDAVPGTVRDSLESLRLAVREGLRAVAEADGGALLADAVVAGAERQIGFRLDRLERRLLAAAKRRGNDALRDLAFARAHIWPDGHPQERTLNFIPFLGRYGEGLWTAMREAAGEHARRVLRGPGASGDR